MIQSGSRTKAFTAQMRAEETYKYELISITSIQQILNPWTWNLLFSAKTVKKAGSIQTRHLVYLHCERHKVMKWLSVDIFFSGKHLDFCVMSFPCKKLSRYHWNASVTVLESPDVVLHDSDIIEVTGLSYISVIKWWTFLKVFEKK
jgi:hypothetical protein